VAVYFLNLKTFGRSGGSSAVSAAAYRSGERLRDERAGRTYDHTDRRDVLYKEILLPGDLTAADMSWAKDRSQLWNAAESAESRKNARVAREYLVALPVELSPGQRLDLARGFSQELVERYRFALDLTIHAPRDYPGSDPRNFHAHLLATTREATAFGLAAKTTLELNDAKRHELGLRPVVHELLFVRERWAEVTNEALRGANIAARVDHRSLAAQGIDREPYPRIPRAAFEMERQGYRSDQAERLRAQYQERVQAREREAARGERAQARRDDTPAPEREAAQGEREAAHAAPVSAASASAAAASAAAAQGAAAQGAAARPQPQSLDDIRRQAREDWLRMRQEAISKTPAAAPERIAAPERTVGPPRTMGPGGIDDDFLSR
jgi:ATP-dependent exoDNAse (exonuclease V) alpha subunit